MASDLRESIDFSEGMEEGFGLPRIIVAGLGGAGNNTVSRLARIGLAGAKTVAINTDSQHLKTVQADEKMLIGRKLTRGMGAGGDPAVGRKAAEQALPDLENLFRGADLVFVTAGMGGGTGTGSAPVVAKVARDRGASVVAMVSTPFHLEKARVLVAEEGLEALRSYADTLIVMDNNRLLDYAPHLPVLQAFSVLDQIVAEIILEICNTLTHPSLINLDYADVRTIMKTGGASFMFVGEGSMKNSPENIVRSSLKNPLLEVDVRGAKACLLHLTGGPDMTLREAAALAGALTQELDAGANVIWGARIRPEYAGKVRLMAIITGVKSAQVLGPAGGATEAGPEREKHIREKYVDIDTIR
ncbi:Cell division protein FtsZ 1 [uncultured archaeon]|nr:Cell division protein FtsZ 1 [uncultured archaeon]